MTQSLAKRIGFRCFLHAIVFSALLAAGPVAATVPNQALFTTPTTEARCVGDCAQQGHVRINDLILGVAIALGEHPVSECPAFADPAGRVTIAQLIQGVKNALGECPVPPRPTCQPGCR